MVAPGVARHNVEFRDAKSKYRKVKQRIQGGVLSTIHGDICRLTHDYTSSVRQLPANLAQLCMQSTLTRFLAEKPNALFSLPGGTVKQL